MEWQPISTAPKNPSGEFHGPTILVFSKADNLTWPAYWAEGKTGSGTWFVPDAHEPEFDVRDVTHWMPLPAPPPDTEKA